MKLHFVETQQPLTRMECAELASQLTEALQAKGRPHDQVVVLAQCTYGGNVEIHHVATETF